MTGIVYWIEMHYLLKSALFIEQDHAIMQNVMFVWDKLDLVAKIDDAKDGAAPEIQLGKRGSGDNVYFVKRKISAMESGKLRWYLMCHYYIKVTWHRVDVDTVSLSDNDIEPDGSDRDDDQVSINDGWVDGAFLYICNVLT